MRCEGDGPQIAANNRDTLPIPSIPKHVQKIKARAASDLFQLFLFTMPCHYVFWPSRSIISGNESACGSSDEQEVYHHSVQIWSMMGIATLRNGILTQTPDSDDAS